MPLKYVLESNLLTKDPNDRYARPVDVRTHTEEDLADAVSKRNPSINKSFYLAMKATEAEVITDWVTEGDSILTKTVHIHPTIPGTVKEGEHPKEAAIKVTPGKLLAEAAKKIRLQHTEPMSQIRIEFVHDIQSNTTNDTITRGGTVKITGYKLKIAGENPAVGVEFLSQEDPEAIYKVTPKNILINNPSELLVIAPRMVVGEKVLVKVTTQYSGTGTPLKSIRSYTLDKELTVIDGGNE
ncbi:MAG: DUF4469 domain-containing protein [Dysgonamonadaceae bacterium]|jgi:hypothetical protein|nr:DUF4469 domain-containing protein [Dysgonamonadaceae bacterium]